MSFDEMRVRILLVELPLRGGFSTTDFPLIRDYFENPGLFWGIRTQNPGFFDNNPGLFIKNPGFFHFLVESRIFIAMFGLDYRIPPIGSSGKTRIIL